VKNTLKVVGIVVVLLIIIAIALPFLINVNRFRPQIESDLSSSLGRPVKVGDMSLSILSGSVEANDLSIADDPKFSNSPFLQAKSLGVGVELMPLIFSKQVNVTHLTIKEPQVVLLRNQAGLWNFSSLGTQGASQQASSPAKTSANPKSGASSSPGNLNVAKLELTDGKISVGSIPPKRNPIVYNKVNVTITDFSFTSKFPVVASAQLPGGGSLKIDGTAGPINPTDTTLTPVQAKISLNKLDLAQSALLDPNLGVTGSADFDGTLSSDGRIAKANGTLKATSLKLVPKGSPSGSPVQVVFAVEHNLQTETGTLTQGNIGIGKALARLTGTYDMKNDTTSVNMNLSGQNMPVDDLEAALPAVGVSLPSGSKLKGGTLSVDLNATGPLDKIVSTGTIRMTGASLSGFSLMSKLSAIPGLAGKQSGNDTVIQNLSSNVRYAPDGTRLDKINLVVSSLGTVTGAGTVSPSNNLDFNLVANLSGVGGELTKGLGAGSGGIPVKVGGTTSNPTFTPDMKGLLGNQLKNLAIPGGKANPLGNLGGLFGKKKPN